MTRHHLQAERHVARYRHVAEQRVVLEHQSDAAFARRNALHRASVDHHVAGIDELQASEHPQQRGLAGAGRSQQRQEFAALDASG